MLHFPSAVVLDLKGCQYQGNILPGPTAMVIGLSKGRQLKVEGITDEFSRLVKTQDVMAKLDAVVRGDMDDGFLVRDENVNASKESTIISNKENTKESISKAKQSIGPKKRPAAAQSGKSANKKRKSTPTIMEQSASKKKKAIQNRKKSL